jgi:hypothetical protein
MADRLYVSYWVRGFGAMTMLREFEKVLRVFPYSPLSKSSSTLRIYAVSYSEPIVLEVAYPPPIDPKRIIEACTDFQNVDCCYEFETWWDLWGWDGDWKLQPHKVTLACFGPEFEHDTDENLWVEFGPEDTFLPRKAGDPGIAMVRANVQSLLRLVHDIDEKLGAERRQLWSESGGNFAERLTASLEEATQ